MKHLILAAAMLLPMTAQAQRVDHNAVRASQNLYTDLDSLFREAQVVERATRNHIERQRAQRLANDSRNLARQLDQQITQELRRGGNIAQVSRRFQNIAYSIDTVVRDAQYMNNRNLWNAASLVEQSSRTLSQALRVYNPGPGYPGGPGNGPGYPGGPGNGPGYPGGPGNGPGYPGGPGNGPGYPGGPGNGPGYPGGPGNGGQRHSFEATCRVVLETLWGTDIQDFYGYATANSEAAATNLARQDGQRQCQSALGGLNKCTVASCDAARIR